MQRSITRSLLEVSDPHLVATPDHPDRRLPFTGAFNFRDVGGYRGRAGQTVRWRTLYRADALHRLPDDELDELAVMGIRTVLDLRTGAEVGHGRIEAEHLGIVHLHLPFIPDVWERADLDPDAEPDQILGQLYIDMLSAGATVHRRGAADAGRSREGPRRVPLHRRKGPHRRARRARCSPSSASTTTRSSATTS